MRDAFKLKLWEALAAAEVTPTRAVLLMESQRERVTVAEAEQQLLDAAGRNFLRLVTVEAKAEAHDLSARDFQPATRSNWLSRIGHK